MGQGYASQDTENGYEELKTLEQGPTQSLPSEYACFRHYARPSTSTSETPLSTQTESGLWPCYDACAGLDGCVRAQFLPSSGECQLFSEWRGDEDGPWEAWMGGVTMKMETCLLYSGVPSLPTR